jgi:YD repeat-containing protein
MLFWNHDPIARGWHVYGKGKVSADRSNILPDANVGIYQFSGFMVSTEGTPPPAPCPCGAPGADNGPTGSGNPASPGAPFDGDPVNLATSAFVHAHTDLVVNDIVPLKLRRTYFSNDQAGTREFGSGMSAGMDYLLYNQYPTGLDGPVAHMGLTLPDGVAVDLVCIQGCNYTRSGVFEGQTPGPFYKAVMTFSNAGFYPLEWTLTTKDGTNYVFYGNGGKIKYITDRYGNTTTFTRKPALIGDLTAVISPNGKSIELSRGAYGGSVTEARDNTGRTWTYAYNGGQMISATDPMGGTWYYTWDNGYPANILTIKDPRGNTVVTNTYTQYMGLTKQTYADGSTTLFAWTRNPQNNSAVSSVDVTDRRGNVRRVAFSPDYYVSSDTFALGKPESQTTTFARDPTTNLLLSETDPLGRVTSYTYDAKGSVLTSTRLAGTPNAITWMYTYEPTFHQLVTATDPLGHMITLARDGLGNVTQVVDANNNSMAMTYTSQGQVATRTDALAHTTTLGIAPADQCDRPAISHNINGSG